VNFTLMVQLTPGATELPQAPSPAKAKSPVKAALNVSVALPVFVSVVSCAALLVPTVWLPNVNEVGERLAVEVAFTVAANVPITNNETTNIVALKIFSLIFRLIPISLPFQVFHGDSKSPSSSSVGTSNAANARMGCRCFRAMIRRVPGLCLPAFWARAVAGGSIFLRQVNRRGL
jgi:hypothetical protein